MNALAPETDFAGMTLSDAARLLGKSRTAAYQWLDGRGWRVNRSHNHPIQRAKTATELEDEIAVRLRNAAPVVPCWRCGCRACGCGQRGRG